MNLNDISIHALLAESDAPWFAWLASYVNFYPRSPCGERLDDILAGVNELLISIHALLAESDNNINNSVSTADKDFYPRSPCGERPNFSCLPIELSHISIHALLAESDCCARCHCWGLNEFLSTLSLRRATGRVETAITSIGFLSTLSLRRATLKMYPVRNCTTYFYPRSPCGERRRGLHLFHLFQLISIHALLAESDWLNSHYHIIVANFYPRSPCGERPEICALCLPAGGEISIHALLAESDPPFVM